MPFLLRLLSPPFAFANWWRLGNVVSAGGNCRWYRGKDVTGRGYNWRGVPAPALPLLVFGEDSIIVNSWHPRQYRLFQALVFRDKRLLNRWNGRAAKQRQI